MIWLYLELDKYMLPYNICNLLDIFMSTIGGSSLSTSTFYIKTYKNRKYKSIQGNEKVKLKRFPLL